MLNRPTKTIYVDGFNTFTYIKDGRTYVQIVGKQHAMATPVTVAERFQPQLIYGKEYMVCLDRNGNCA